MNKLLHGDCLELMNDIPDGSIDMMLQLIATVFNWRAIQKGGDKSSSPFFCFQKSLE